MIPLSQDDTQTNPSPPSGKQPTSSKKSTIIIISIVVSILLIVSFVHIANRGLYIPGFNIKSWGTSEKVPLNVNKLVSIHKTIPFKYADLPVCDVVPNSKEIENLGEVLLGDRIEEYSIDLKMKVDSTCVIQCEKDVDAAGIAKLRDFIADDYKAEWLIDSLPAALKLTKPEETPSYDTRFFLGYKEGEKTVYFNHFVLKVHYNDAKKEPFEDQDSPSRYNIVFFEIELQSIDYSLSSNKNDACTGKRELLVLPPTGSKKITYSYSVKWVKDETAWVNRWDNYVKKSNDGEIHWFSIINSLLIVLFLTVMVAMILTKTLRNDCMRYNTTDVEEMDETGWKQIHGDILRKPRYPIIFSVLIGSGVQLLAMAILTIAFALFGFLSPANRGGLLTAVIVIFVLMGVVAGYFSTRVLKIMGVGDNWDVVKRTTIFTALFFPGVIFLITLFLNFFLIGSGSSSAIPFGTIVAIIALWSGISIPLCFVGSYFGYKKQAPSQFAQLSIIAKPIPEQPWYMHPLISILMGGILPFGAVFIELYFILSSIWEQKYYYLFGFLFIVFLILVITCSEITIVMCYFQLCSSDYNWWWRSFGTGAATGLYTFFYSIFYLVTKLQIEGVVSIVLYVGYSLTMSLCVAVVTGMIGFFSSYYFIRTIYSHVHLY